MPQYLAISLVPVWQKVQTNGIAEKQKCLSQVF